MLTETSTEYDTLNTKFICEACDFKCSKNSHWNRHILTTKHIKLTTTMAPETKKDYSCIICKKKYSRVGLWKHKKKCIKKIDNPTNNNIELKILYNKNDDDNNTNYEFICDEKNENVIIDKNEYHNKEAVIDSSANQIQLLTSMVLEVCKSNTILQTQNQEIQKQIIEFHKNNTDLQKQNQDIQKQMLEVCKNIQPSNNNTTINNENNNTINANKTFNLNVFLNEKCKDAMNLDDFANSIQLKLSDLIRVGEEGYIPGMSKVIIEWLKKLEECQRPIHCSDEKREVIQVKMADKWEKEAITSEKLMNAVRIVEKKQFDMITTFRDTYPECMNSESHHNDMLIKLFQNLSNSREPEFIKVMKKVAKSVVIDKEENA